MSNKRNDDRRLYTYVTVGLAVLLAFALVVPILAPAQQPVQTVEPTAVAGPTAPPPITNFDDIAFTETYLHPSGVYTVNYPAGWTPSSPSNNGSLVQVNFNNQEQLSVIETIYEEPATPFENLDALSTHYDSAFLQSSWSRYNSWEETARFTDEETGKVTIDFELSLGGQDYLARQTSSLNEDGTVDTVRVVVPSNSRDYLLFLLDGMQNSIEPVQLFADSPTGWTSFYNEEDGYVIRYPSFWRITDGEAGAPVTIEGGDNILQLMASADLSVASEDDASSYVASLRPNTEVLTVQPVERQDASGYAVSYQTRTVDGTAQSGLVVLLNDGEGKTLVSDLRLRDISADLLNIEEESSALTDAVNVLDSFNLSSSVGLNTAEEETPTEEESTTEDNTSSD